MPIWSFKIDNSLYQEIRMAGMQGKLANIQFWRNVNPRAKKSIVSVQAKDIGTVVETLKPVLGGHIPFDKEFIESQMNSLR